jgi:hypothetical protein
VTQRQHEKKTRAGNLLPPSFGLENYAVLFSFVSVVLFRNYEDNNNLPGRIKVLSLLKDNYCAVDSFIPHNNLLYSTLINLAIKYANTKTSIAQHSR